MAQTIAVDFDRVLHTYERGWADGLIYGELMPGALPALVTLMLRYAVYVHTTRSPRQVAAWIEEKSGRSIECVTWPWWHRGKFWNRQGVLLVSNRKLPALAYVDDRAVRFESWDQAMAELDARLGSAT